MIEIKEAGLEMAKFHHEVQRRLISDLRKKIIESIPNGDERFLFFAGDRVFYGDRLIGHFNLTASYDGQDFIQNRFSIVAKFIPK